MTNAERLRLLRAEARASGRCSQCRCRPVSPGLLTCSTCLVAAREYKERARQGITPIERKPVKAKAKAKAKLPPRVRTPEQIEKNKANMRRRYLRLKLEGKCVRCAGGLLDDEMDSLHCQPCKDDIAAWARSASGKRTNAKRKARARKQHEAAGLCIDCMKPPAPGLRRCDDCTDTHQLACLKWRERKRDERRAA
jgi:hypothetical protein